MTLALSRFTIENVDDSALHALGVNTANLSEEAGHA